ncbi:MAG: nucleotide exchange factor GrpE [Candidatus Shikimatogenerans bostrichidophilus]|nr:MAG: nucleotide exchange factor GrpE [Candidatus Shikimatogenerans bostrichidophilus]
MNKKNNKKILNEKNTEISFNEKIKKYKKKNNLLKDKFLRILADFENYKKRNELEKKNIFKINISKIIKDILPILDDFDRLIKEEKINNKNVIFLIYKKFKKILKNYGLKKIKVNIGDNFNIDCHEAVLKSNIKNKEMKKKIIKILENGYFVDDKIIRCTKVIVGN